MTDSLTLCLSCATLAVGGHDRELCPTCGEAVDRRRVERALDVADFIVRYGYHYRRHYEEDGVETRALIDFDAIWIFVGAAVLSGLLGNAAYDLVKAAIGRIIESYESLRPGKDTSPLRRLLIDEQAYYEFADYLEEYLRGMPELDPAIRPAIAEEVLVHEITRERMELLRKRGVFEQLIGGARNLERVPGEELVEAKRRANQVAHERAVASFESASYFVAWWNQLTLPTEEDFVEPTAGVDD